nr:isoform 3 of kinesin light chain 3 [Quercus suber]
MAMTWRALKIEGRVLGYGHTDYSDTMYHLGMVLYLQGKEKDSEALIQDSIRILEEGGQGESSVCIKRLRYLAQIYLKSNRPREAENVQRKILHIMELSKGWNSLDTIIAAEGLAMTLQSAENLKEAQELFERCLDARKMLLPKDHIQIGANMLHIARVAMLNCNRLRKLDISGAISELEKAKDLLENSTRSILSN